MRHGRNASSPRLARPGRPRAPPAPAPARPALDQARPSIRSSAVTRQPPPCSGLAPGPAEPAAAPTTIAGPEQQMVLLTETDTQLLSPERHL